MSTDTIPEAAKTLRDSLERMFPALYVNVTEGGRGISLEVARLDERSFLKEQMSNGYRGPPNNAVKIVIAPPPNTHGAWGAKNLTVKPALTNPELKASGLKTIRRAHNVGPDAAVEAVLKYFESIKGHLTK